MTPFARLIVLLCVLAGVGMVAMAFVFAYPHTAEVLSAAPTVESVVDDVLAARTSAVLTQDAVPYGDKDVINVLVLGIDSRKEGDERHCDAIHMFSVNVATWDVVITSIPRGTTSPLPPRAPGEVPYMPTDYYLANACGYGGLAYGVAQIENVAGVKHDYVVTVGFSQALGVFRALGLPTTDTLQWLRHRHSYAIGDPQRSHNQAVFMEDLIRTYGAPENRLPATFLYVLYKFVDTDMSFGTVRSLYGAYVDADRVEDPAAITHDMKPYYATVDYHLDLENADVQIAELLDRIRGKISTQDLSDRPLSEVQAELIVYLNDALQQPEEAQRVVDDELWLQVEDDDTRETLQYAFTAWYVTALAPSDRDAAVDFVSDYILEKQTFGPVEYEVQGRQLLAAIVQ